MKKPPAGIAVPLAPILGLVPSGVQSWVERFPTPIIFRYGVPSIRRNEYMSRAMRLKLMCNECGTVFHKKVGADVMEVQCPKCGGYDTDLYICAVCKIEREEL
jgi:predicted Zn finger-like uncharacterized protein